MGVRTQVWVPIGGSLVVGSVIGVRFAHLATSPDGVWIQSVPDDAFYYVGLARNAAADRSWSLDGENSSSGFHVLYGYMLRMLFTVEPNLTSRHIFLIIGLAAIAALSSAAAVTLAMVQRQWGTRATPWVLIPFLSPAGVSQATLIMESWLVPIIMAGTLWFVASSRITMRRTLPVLFALGVLGMLTRTDYLAFAGALMFGGLMSLHQRSRATALKLAVAASGAGFGAVLVAIHTYSISDSLIQTSARVKSHWTHVQGMSPLDVLQLPTTLVVPQFAFYVPLLATVVGILIVVIAPTKPRARDYSFQPLGSVGVAALAGYCFLYVFDTSALQPWYQANFIVPIALILSWSMTLLFGRGSPLFGTLVAASALALYGLAGSYLSPVWPFGEGMLKAARSPEITALDRTAHIGAWNAGIMSEFSSRPVTNLDGLVNDAAARAVLRGDLLKYLASSRVTHIADAEEMILNPTLGLRGGYNPQLLAQCLRNPRVIDGGIGTWAASPVTLYELDRMCLRDLSLVP